MLQQRIDVAARLHAAHHALQFRDGASELYERHRE
jgi:hypothetical protein